MATATADEVVSASRSAELRTAIDAGWTSAEDKLGVAADVFLDIVGYVSEVDGAISDLWDDLRPSEAERLRAIVAEAKATVVQDCLFELRNAALEAAVRFASEFPDAPRKAAALEVVPAQAAGYTDLVS